MELLGLTLAIYLLRRVRRAKAKRRPLFASHTPAGVPERIYCPRTIDLAWTNEFDEIEVLQ